MGIRLNSLSIRTQLLLLVLPLLALLVGLVGHRVWTDWQARVEHRTGMAVVSKVSALAGLIHQVQLERGLSAAWLNGNKAADLEALKAQRLRADQALQGGALSLQDAIGRVNGAGDLFTGELQAFQALQAELAGARQAVDSQKWSAPELIDWYTRQIEARIAAIYDSVHHSPSQDFATRIRAYAYLVSTREYHGRERNAIAAALRADKSLDSQTLVLLSEVIARQSTHAELYRQASSPADARALAQVMESPPAREALRIRERVLALSSEGRYGISPEVWWAAITEKMNLLKAHDERMSQALTTSAEQEARAAEQRFGTTLALAAALLLVALAMVYLIVSGIQQRLSDLQQAMVRISRNFDFRERVQVQGADEIARTAESFNAMMHVISGALSEVDQVMAALAAGDFSRQVSMPLTGDMERLKSSVNATRQRIGSTMAVLNDAMLAMQDGDFSRHIQVEAEGEYRRALDCAQGAMQALQSMIGRIGLVMEGVAAGKLTERVDVDGQGQLARLRDDINASLDALSRAMAQISGNTRMVASASNETSTAIGQIADGAQNQTHAISQVAAAVRQTTTAVGDVSRSTASASDQSRESVNIVRSGMDKMQRMVEVVTSIAANSERISKITEMIEKIANKTNLLSLNAAIEAARAGEHGRGFAVVADEIGKLAISSAQSSQEIARLVQQAVSETDQAVAAVQEVQADMGRIETGAQQTDSLLRQISSAIEEQASAVEEINANLGSLDRIARSNAAAAEEITATVIELSRLADGTRSEVERFSVTPV